MLAFVTLIPARHWSAISARFLLVAVATLLRLALNPLWGTKLPYLFYLPSLVPVTWLGGRGPGFLWRSP